MEVLLNIGLACNNNKNIGAGTVLREIENQGLTLKQHVIVYSDTEPTVVALVDGDTRGSALYQLSRVLHQDCIAVYSPDETFGLLVGPKAAAWGAFDPSFFFMLDGARLAEPRQIAA